MTIQYLLNGNEHGTNLVLERKNLLSEERQAMMADIWDYLLARLKSYAEHA